MYKRQADETAAEAVLTRAELARALNSLLGRCPDGQDAQLQAAAWYRDNQDQTAWYYADLIEALSLIHICPPARAVPDNVFHSVVP